MNPRGNIALEIWYEKRGWVQEAAVNSLYPVQQMGQTGAIKTHGNHCGKALLWHPCSAERNGKQQAHPTSPYKYWMGRPEE